MDNIKAVFNPNWNGEENYLVNYNDTIQAYHDRKPFYTNQMCIMEFCWFNGYDVYIVNNNGDEVLIANDGTLTPKDLRPAHNIFKIWRSGGFPINSI